jgi:hypothetical protein
LDHERWRLDQYVLELKMDNLSDEATESYPAKPLEQFDLQTAIAQFPRLFHGEPPRIPGWVLPGWQSLVKRLLTSIDKAPTDTDSADFCLLQVKEQWGSLCFYFQAPDRVRDQLSALVERASQESATRCMRCGKPATLADNGGWKAVLCADHQTQPLSRLGDL